MRQVCFYLLAVLVLASLGGCGGLEQFPLAKVTGTVTCEGKPVANAIIFFEPIRSGDSKSAEVGKQGYALSDADGKYEVSTYSDGDGAVVGKHLVRVGKSETSSPCNCALNASIVLQEVDVLAEGPHVFDLVLKKKSAQNRDELAEED